MSWTKKTLCTGYIELNSKNPLEKFFISQQYTYTVWLNCMVFILLINIILIEKWINQYIKKYLCKKINIITLKILINKKKH